MVFEPSLILMRDAGTIACSGARVRRGSHRDPARRRGVPPSVPGGGRQNVAPPRVAVADEGRGPVARASLGAHGAIFFSSPSLPPYVPRTPARGGWNHNRRCPRDIRPPELLHCPVDICPVDIFAQRQHVWIARPTLKAIDQEQSIVAVHHWTVWSSICGPYFVAR
jgi:hypothetical protein